MSRLSDLEAQMRKIVGDPEPIPPTEHLPTEPVPPIEGNANITMPPPAVEPAAEPVSPLDLTAGDINAAAEPKPAEDEFFQAPPEPERNPAFVTSSRSLTAEELTALFPPKVERREGVVLDTLGQPPTVSDRTQAELDAGRARVNENLEMQRSAQTGEVSPVVAEARAKINARLEAERSAGRAAVARKQADINRAKKITADGHAQALHNRAAAKPDDLSYNQPR